MPYMQTALWNRIKILKSRQDAVVVVAHKSRSQAIIIGVQQSKCRENVLRKRLGMIGWDNLLFNVVPLDNERVEIVFRLRSIMPVVEVIDERYSK